MAPAHDLTRLLHDRDVLRELERLTSLARATFKGQLQLQQRRRAGAFEFEEYRAYQAGDDLRHVDWHAWQRLDQLVVKRYRGERDLQMTLLVDHSTSMTLGSPAKMAYAERLAGMLGFIALQLFDRVLVASLPFRPGMPLGQYRGVAQARKLLRDLAGCSPSGACQPVASMRQLLDCHPGRGRAIWIGDFADDSGWDQAFHYLAIKGIAADIVQIVAPEELDPPMDWDGGLRIYDVEGCEQDHLEFELDQRLRSGYRAAFAAHCQAIHRSAVARQHRWLQIMTSDVPEAAIECLLASGLMLR
jgi:uncharacterized protein (DUF58 family)